MRIAFDDFLTLGWMPSKIRPPQLSLTLFVKGTFKLIPGGPAVPVDEEPEFPLGDVFWDEDPEKSLYYSSDFVPLKPRADLLLVGKCHTPGGRLAQACRPIFQVGPRSKPIGVFGNRFWKGLLKSMSDPEPFTEMEIRYENSFGGEGYKKNPLGKGFWKKQEGDGNKIWPLPNLEDPQDLIRSTSSSPDPAGFGPLNMMWQQRFSQAGTYKKEWEEERWPWYPKDLDWGFFNSAPPDMQVEGYLKGDEKLYFENLHPEISQYHSQLPGLRARCFVNKFDPKDETQTHFEEVVLQLDTLWVDMETEKLILVWRGDTPIRHIKLKDIEGIIAGTEPLSDPPHDKEYFWKRLEEYYTDADAEQEEMEDAASWAAFDKSFEDMETDFAQMEKDALQMDKEMAVLEAEAKKAMDDNIRQALERGMDPAFLDKPVEGKTLEEAQVVLKAIKSRLEVSDPKHAEYIQDVDLSVQKEAEELDKTQEKFDQDMAEMDEPPMTRESVQEASVKKESLAEKNLSKLDLSGLDLGGMDFTDADLSDTDLKMTNLSRSNLRGADLTGCDLSDADLTGAVLDDADLAGSKLVGAKLTGMSINDTEFSELELESADFSGCRGKRADFSGTNLNKARFVGAQLIQTDFTGCNLEQADFSGADLQTSHFYQVNAPKIVMEGANLSGLQASEKSDFSEANFRKVKGGGSIWEESVLDKADFSGAELERAMFSESSLKGAIFLRANLGNANFEDACLDGAVMRESNLLRASFERASLIGTDLSRANLYESSFWEAKTLNTNVYGANLKKALRPKEHE
jgi:uncharacterized protein YjbI with pentapeptide repeats